MFKNLIIGILSCIIILIALLFSQLLFPSTSHLDMFVEPNFKGNFNGPVEKYLLHEKALKHPGFAYAKYEMFNEWDIDKIQNNENLYFINESSNSKEFASFYKGLLEGIANEAKVRPELEGLFDFLKEKDKITFVMSTTERQRGESFREGMFLRKDLDKNCSIFRADKDFFYTITLKHCRYILED